MKCLGSFGCNTGLGVLGSVMQEMASNSLDAGLRDLAPAAEFAGPIREGSQDTLKALFRAGNAGRAPTGKELADAIAPALTGAATIGATAACGTVVGPAAPLCGMAAGYVMNQLAGIFSGGGGSSCTIHGTPCDLVWKRYREDGARMCAPGDEPCRTDQKNIVNVYYGVWSKSVGAQPCPTKQVTTMTPFGPITQTVKVDPNCTFVASKTSPDQVLRELNKALQLRGIQSRADAERGFLVSVEKTATRAYAPFKASCPSSGCQKIAEGIMREAALSAGEKLREGDYDGAELIWKSAKLQAQGAFEQAVIQKQMQGQIKTTDEQVDSLSTNMRRAIVAAVAIGAFGFWAYNARKKR